MVDREHYSALDLVLMIIGLKQLASPPPATAAGYDYWFADGRLRETRWDWGASPSETWRKVRHRDALVAALLESLAKDTTVFTAIDEPLSSSFDVLSNRAAPGMRGASQESEAIVKTENGYHRSFLSAVSLGVSRSTLAGREHVVIGAGVRRCTQVWRGATNADAARQNDALQIEGEFFVPFFVVPDGSGIPPDDGARAICAGLAVTRAGHGTISEGVGGFRAHVRIPWATRTDGAGRTVGAFGAPQTGVQQRPARSPGGSVPPWEAAEDSWAEWMTDLAGTAEGRELLAAPLGPVHAAKSHGSVADELDRLRKVLSGAVPHRPADPTQTSSKEEKEEEEGDRVAASGERTVSELLTALGLLEDEAPVTDPGDAWEVVNRLLQELDGVPVYVRGYDGRDDSGLRALLALAAQADPEDPRRTHLGLVGSASDIALGTPASSPANPPKSKAPTDTPGAPDAADTPDVVEGFVSDSAFFGPDATSTLGAPEVEAKAEAKATEPGTGAAKKDPAKKDPATKDPATTSAVRSRLHLGKWLHGETMDDNWFGRLLPRDGSAGRAPLPGVRVLPLTRLVTDDVTGEHVEPFVWAPRGELMSIGLDVDRPDGTPLLGGPRGGTGPLSYFGLGGIELRGSLLIGHDDRGIDTRFGLAVRLRDIRLSFAPRKEPEKSEEPENPEEEDDVLLGLRDLFAEPEEPKKPALKTRLSAEQDDTFSLSLGYLSPGTDGFGTLDVQLWDADGERTDLVLIPIERSLGFVHVKNVEIGVSGVEGVPVGDWDSASKDIKLSVGFTGGVRASAFELGFIGARLTVPLARPGAPTFGLDGLDVSFRAKQLVVSGAFQREDGEYAGYVTVDAPKVSIAAMGAFGKVKKSDGTPTGDTTCFVFGSLSATEGGGIALGPILLTGLALGFGINREVLTPPVDEVADFPLVKLVMGTGGLRTGNDADKDADTDVNKDLGSDLRNQLGKPVKKPMKVLEQMQEHLPAREGSTFGCVGVRFSVGHTADCFALLIVQWGNDLEIALLGLARIRLPRSPERPALCYLELQVLAGIKPSEGLVRVEAALSHNSWILNKDCRVSGGFAAYVWFAGQHRGDFVVSLGGYHPRFARPAHYPVVPRLALNWQLSEWMRLTGSGYFAITSSCLMVGAHLEAVLHASRVSLWMTLDFDAVVAWSPLHFEVDLALSIRVEVDLFLYTFRGGVSAALKLWGPPTGGTVALSVGGLDFVVPFGKDRVAPAPIASWGEFCAGSLAPAPSTPTASTPTGRTPTGGTPTGSSPAAADPAGFVQPSLAAGRANPPEGRPGQDQGESWTVRGDQVRFAVSSVVPFTELAVGTVATNSPPQGVRPLAESGRGRTVDEPVVLNGRTHRETGTPLGVGPMKKDLRSTLTVTVVRDGAGGSTTAVDIATWTLEAERQSVPAALWSAQGGPAGPRAAPLTGCLTGVGSLTPPRGDRGGHVVIDALRLAEIAPGTVWRARIGQPGPGEARSPRAEVLADMQRATEARRALHAALGRAGFVLDPAAVTRPVRFRALRAEPLAGAVTAVAR